MNRQFKLIVAVIVLLVLSACSPSAEQLAATYVAGTSAAVDAAGTAAAPSRESTSSPDATLPATATTAPTPTHAPSATPTTLAALDLLTALDEGLVSIDAAHGDLEGYALEVQISTVNDAGLSSHHGSLIQGIDYVEIHLQNNSNGDLQIMLPAGMLLGDDDPLTVDLVLPAAAGVEMAPGSEVSISIPSYQAALEIPDPGDEIDERDFINPVPLPGAPLTILGVDERLGAVLEAAGQAAQAVFNPYAQLALLATASDIWAQDVLLCDSNIVSVWAIPLGDRVDLKCPLKAAIGNWAVESGGAFTTGFQLPSNQNAHAVIPREILRIAAGLNEQLATPFRVAIQPGNGALGVEELQAALVALVDQAHVEELYGFGVTFHLAPAGPIPEAGLATLPEITDGGMSPAEARETIASWIAANGSLEFKVHVHSGHYMIVLSQLLADNWHEAGASPDIIVNEFGSLAFMFFSEGIEDIAVEHRPGLLP